MTNEIDPTRSIESSLPRPWERERGFDDALYEWMQHAPWLALSALAHALLLLVLLAIPWDLIHPAQHLGFVATLDAPEPEPFVEVPPDEPEDVQVEEPSDEPVLQSADEPLEPVEDDPRTSPSDLDSDLSDALSRVDGQLSEIGLGGGWRPGGGGHMGNRGQGRPGGGRGVEVAVGHALAWLADHQAPDGRWSGARFMHENGLGRSCSCDGPGQDVHDVGLTGLALLAFLGDGHTTREGAYREVVARGVRWLGEQQDRDSGLIGPRAGHGFVYDHAIATLALCEAYYFSRNPLLERKAQLAVDYVLLARNPYGAWRYEVPPNGESDTSVTGWMVLALASASDGGLRVDPTAFAGALSWLDEVTDPSTGRVGYTSAGSPSSRIERVNDHFPTDSGEAMTAVGLLARFFLGQEPRSLGGPDEVLDRHADLLARRPPLWDPEGRGCDMYYWYYGSYAMYQMGGGRYWEPWNRAMKKAVVDSQRRDGDALGSWDPVGPWGFTGGRVYSTALMTLCLEVYYRYARIVGAR